MLIWHYDMESLPPNFGSYYQKSCWSKDEGLWLTSYPRSICKYASKLRIRSLRRMIQGEPYSSANMDGDKSIALFFLPFLFLIFFIFIFIFLKRNMFGSYCRKFLKSNTPRKHSNLAKDDIAWVQFYSLFFYHKNTTMAKIAIIQRL